MQCAGNAVTLRTQDGFYRKSRKRFFGKQLEDAITEVGIDAAGLLKDDKVHTTLALVHTYPDGDRDFSFYRNPGADMMLMEEELPEEIIRGAKSFISERCP